jgi:acetyl/propionyl-CoA carboxylase alpha subunit
MLAKLIVHAENREAATQRMQAALREFIVHGVTTNIDFMGSLLAHEDFKNGQVTTRWVETKFNWGAGEPTVEALVAAGIGEMGQKSQVEGRSVEAYSPWKVANGFRN